MENTKEQHTTASGLLPFDPIVLVQDVLKRWLVILLAAVAVGVGAYVATDMSYEPSYRTTTIFVVTNRGSSTTVYNNLSATNSLASLFTELLSSSVMRRNIMKEMEVSSLDATISTSVIEGTNLITMTVTSPDPRTAFLTAQTLIQEHESLTYTVVNGVLIEVLQYPTIPTAPINSADAMGRMKKMALLAGLAAAVALAALSFFRDAVRSGSEAQAKLECEYLGEIPHERKYKTIFAGLSRRKTSILIDNPVTSFRYVETIRKLSRRVEKRLDGGKVLMVTSLLENEGKSTVAANLALDLAKKRGKVLLIDCDLRKPACHAILEMKHFDTGLKDVLQATAALSDSIIPYQNTNMDVLLTRRSERNSGDLLTSERMEMLLDWARRTYDYVILDMPPMGVASDAEGMTALADACLLVVRQNAALAPALNKAVAALDDHRAKLLGCVLNNVYSSSLTSGGGYGYGYGHGYSRYGKYDHYSRYDTRK